MWRIIPTSLALLVLTLVAGPGAAANTLPKPLKLTIKSIMPRARSQAPQTFEVNISCNSPELFQGRLELKIYLGKRLVHEFLSHDLAVTAGDYRFRLVLPPLVIRREKTPLAAIGRFVSAKLTLELGEHELVIPAAWKRSLVIVVVQPPEILLTQGKRGLGESLALEQFNPFGALTFDPLSDAQYDLLTYVPRLTPEELPVTAAGYASFDLLVVEGDGFRGLRPKQLTAIGDWTAAGGSLVVAPAGKMSADHVDFLNRIAGSVSRDNEGNHDKTAAYALSESGSLEIGERMATSGVKFVRLYCGLGRSLLIHERPDPDVDFGTPEWKESVAFLWKVRASQIEPILNEGVWKYPMHQEPNRYGAFRPYAPQRDELPRDIRKFLLPERIEGVPLWVVVIILSLYLVVIAPGDYFLLGRLNCRKYTWGLFVLTSAAFTGFTVMIADSYMGHADYKTTLVFADLADGGDSKRTDSQGAASPAGASYESVRLARVSRFEMLFTATQRMIEIPVKNALYVDLTKRTLMPQLSPRDRRSFVFADDEEMDEMEAVAADLPVYEGLMPGSYSIEQQMRQWSPRVNRQTTIGHVPELLAETAIDWKSLRPAEWNTPAGRQILCDALVAKEPAARVLLFCGTSCFDLVNDGRIEVPAPGQPGIDAQTMFNLLHESSIVSLVRAASVRQPTGLFAVVSQISPTGGEYLEDLALLDGGDPQQWLLAVVVPRGNKWLVFRRLYRGSQP